MASVRFEADRSLGRSFGDGGMIRPCSYPFVEGLAEGALVAGGGIADPRESGYPVLYRLSE